MDLTTDKNQADNRRLEQWRVTWLIEHSTSRPHFCVVMIFLIV